MLINPYIVQAAIPPITLPLVPYRSPSVITGSWGYLTATGTNSSWYYTPNYMSSIGSTDWIYSTYLGAADRNIFEVSTDVYIQFQAQTEQSNDYSLKVGLSNLSQSETIGNDLFNGGTGNSVNSFGYFYGNKGANGSTFIYNQVAVSTPNHEHTSSPMCLRFQDLGTSVKISDWSVGSDVGNYTILKSSMPGPYRIAISSGGYCEYMLFNTATKTVTIPGSTYLL